MIGSLFAGTDESPGETILYQGRSFKSYRGMGSLGAMRSGSADRYAQGDETPAKLVPEGIEGLVPYKGALDVMVHQLVGGLKASMGYCGVPEYRGHAVEDALRPRELTAGLRESHVHDVVITEGGAEPISPISALAACSASSRSFCFGLPSCLDRIVVLWCPARIVRQTLHVHPPRASAKSCAY